jgi:hypothetical protein
MQIIFMKKNKLGQIRIAAITLLCIFNFVGCKKDSGGTTAPTTITKSIYVAGYETKGSVPIAKLWKNGVATNLTNGTNSAYATSVFVKDTDVFVAGFEFSGSHSVAKYWKNGIATNLTDGTNSAQAELIYALGNDIYVAGVEFIGAQAVVKLWKNGTPTIESSNGIVMGLSQYNGEVYVTGYEYDNSSRTYSIETAWDNGVKVSVNRVGNSVVSSARFFSVPNIYLASTGSFSPYPHNIALIINSGTSAEIKLTDGNYDAGATSVLVQDSVIYATGYESNGTNEIAKYWKGTVATSLTDGTNDAKAYSIFIK